MRIRVYDKIKEVTKQPGDVLRVEVQLRGKLVKKYLARGQEEVGTLRFTDCYHAYRDILLGFTPAKPPAISSWAQMFVIAQVAGWQIEGCTPFDLWAIGKNRQHVQRMRRQMAAARLRPQ